jgi:predicted regulator of Ras-like GTPase activity (Roadblock/LC7/MglB family)
MQSFEGSEFQERQGFNGSVANLSLSDLIQLQSHKQFSGLIRVYHGGLDGDLYLEAGELVHAEIGGIWGEEAAYHIISWVSGEFHVQESVSPPRRTITKKLTRLLLEFHQRLDEAVRDGSVLAQSEALPSITRNLEATGSKMSALSQKIVTAVPSVRRAVLITSDGTPIDDGSPEAESLAARSIYLATMLANPISSTFGLGDLAVALLESDAEPLVVFRNKDKFLVIQAEEDAALDKIETGIRRLFSTQQG